MTNGEWYSTPRKHTTCLSSKKIRAVLGHIYLNNTIISEINTYCNLGLHITNNLTWTEHIIHNINKASQRLNIISRHRYRLPRLALESLYTTMVRPIIEYGDVIYDGMSLSLGQSLEKTQRRAAIICSGAYRHTETRTLLQEVGWEPLSERRKMHKLTTLYKIQSGIYPAYLRDLIPKATEPRYSLRTVPHIPIIHTRLTTTTKSFFPSTIRLWNNLPRTTIQALQPILSKNS